MEPDLFGETSINPAVESIETKYSKEMIDKTPELSIKNIDNELITKQIPTSKNIDKIMIFFTDKTFLTLIPEE